MLDIQVCRAALLGEENLSASAENTPTQFVRAIEEYESNQPASFIQELHLLTDVTIYGEARDVGPFSFINTLVHAGARNGRGLTPGMMLRVKYSGSQKYAVRFDDNYKHYSGGDLADEVAAICTMLLGVRIVAGSLKREFYDCADPLGSPREYQTRITPFFQADYRRLRIPRACVDVNISALAMLDRIAKLPKSVSTALIKSSRLYQQALLMCEALPEVAWLLLVSALETVAAEHAFKVSDRRETFRQSHPEVAILLAKFEDVEQKLADYFFNLSRSKAKFVNFINRFLPPPPAKRPPPAFCFSMEQPELDAGISAIYKHMSTHLHGGTAFPGPMCEPPQYFAFADQSLEGFQEKPMGHGANYSGASWSAVSCPMLLHHFEYIARGCILNWWASHDSEIEIGADSREIKNISLP